MQNQYEKKLRLANELPISIPSWQKKIVFFRSADTFNKCWHGNATVLIIFKGECRNRNTNWLRKIGNWNRSCISLAKKLLILAFNSCIVCIQLLLRIWFNWYDIFDEDGIHRRHTKECHIIQSIGRLDASIFRSDHKDVI